MATWTGRDREEAPVEMLWQPAAEEERRVPLRMERHVLWPAGLVGLALKPYVTTILPYGGWFISGALLWFQPRPGRAAAGSPGSEPGPG